VSPGRKDTQLNTPKLIALLVVLAMTATPTLSFAKASGGSRGSGGYSSGGSGSFGSRGSRTYDNNKFKPIERSTTPAPSAAPPAARPAAPAVQPQAPSSPPFWQRHPILTGLAAGVAGSWIGHMLFGANNTQAAPSESGATDGANENGGSSMFMLLILMLLGAAAVYYFMKVRRPTATPAYAGLMRNSSGDSTTGLGSAQPAIEVSPISQGGFMSQQQVAIPIDTADQDRFKEILREVQAAWSRQDLDVLKRLTTPEVLHYFSTGLSENASKGIENHVEDIRVLSAEVQEAWSEDATDYATVLFRWSARDYTTALDKQRGEPGYVAEGNDRTPTEESEAWTFMRFQGGKWLLSAIQQAD
jgi:predicted lipid-binding transport protein (Tim44 family)